MFLDLHELIEVPGRRADFACELDGERLAFPALVRFLDYRNASGAVCTGITWLSAGYLMQSTTSAPLQLVPVLRVDTDVYSYYVNIVSGEVSRVSA